MKLLGKYNFVNTESIMVHKGYMHIYVFIYAQSHKNGEKKLEFTNVAMKSLLLIIMCN